MTVLYLKLLHERVFSFALTLRWPKLLEIICKKPCSVGTSCFTFLLLLLSQWGKDVSSCSEINSKLKHKVIKGNIDLLTLISGSTVLASWSIHCHPTEEGWYKVRGQCRGDLGNTILAPF